MAVMPERGDSPKTHDCISGLRGRMIDVVEPAGDIEASAVSLSPTAPRNEWIALDEKAR